MQTPTGTLILLGAALLAGPALAQSAQVNSSGTVIAAETTVRPPNRNPRSSRGETRTDESNSRQSPYLTNDDQPIFDRGQGGSTGNVNERYVDDSTRGEARTDEAAPVNGIGGLGGGRYTFKPTTRSGAADSTDGAPQTGEPGLRSTSTEGGFAPLRPAVTNSIDDSNRDHIDQDAQDDIRKDPSSAPAPGSTDDEPQPGVLRIINNSETDTATVESGVTARPVTLTPDRPR